MACHGGEHEVELFAQKQCLPVQREIVIDIAQKLFRIGPCNGMRQAADKHRGRAEPLDSQTMFGQLRRCILQPVATRFVQFDHFGNKQGLAACHGLFSPRLAQPL